MANTIDVHHGFASSHRFHCDRVFRHLIPVMDTSRLRHRTVFHGEVGKAHK